MVTSHLILNMRWLGYPTPLVNFYEAMLHDCHKMLSFNGLMSEGIRINNSTGQGDPSSMILYLIYSHALVSIPTLAEGDSRAYVDDNFFMAQGIDFMECDCKINTMLNSQERWSMAHNSHVELSKFKCLCLTHCTDMVCPDFQHSDSSITIKCVNSAKLLRVEVDQELC